MVPKFARDYLKLRGGGEREYAIIQLQVAVVLSFLCALLTALNSGFAAVSALFSLLALFVLHSKRKHLDFAPTAFLFGGLAVLGFALALSGIFLAGDMLFVFAYLAFFIVFIAVFKLAYSRDHSEGILLTNGEWAVVQLPFDIRTGTRSGYYAVRGKKGLRKGKRVKVAFKTPFGERRPWRIKS